MAINVQEQWLVMLQTLADRDASVELSRRDGNADSPPVSYRGRMFSVRKDGCIVVERPTQAALDKSFGNGDDIELLLMQNNERLVATCTIHEVFINEINEQTRVTCYLLSPGRRPQRDQRRLFYRVGVAAMDLDEIELSYKDEAGDKSFDFKARLVNLSAGGLGASIRANKTLLNQIKRVSRLECHARFDAANEIMTPVHLTHVSALGDDGLYLGLRFDPDCEFEAKAIEKKMMHLCTQFQRAQLQRRRA